MSKAVLMIFFIITAVGGYAQQRYFMLIQSDNNQPFYARVNEQTYNSSEVGHLVIPQMKDSTYTIYIGFPKNLFPEQKFSVAVNKKEQGFQLKNTGAQWILYNTQTNELKQAIKTDTVVHTVSAGTSVKKDDPFSRLMAGAVNDTAFLYNTYADVVPKKDTTRKDLVKSLPVIKTDKTITDQSAKKTTVDSSQNNSIVKIIEKPKDTLKAEMEKIAPPKTDSQVAAMPIKKPATDSVQKEVTVMKPEEKKKEVGQVMLPKHYEVRKLYEMKTDSAVEMKYVSNTRDGNRDTISLFIPVEKNTPVKTNEVVALKKEEIKELPKADTSQMVKKEVPAAAPTTAPAVTGNSRKDSVNAEPKTMSRTGLVNSNCKTMATDYDVDKLRVKMLAADNEDDRMLVAKKFFRMKCYTTSQVRALSEVFSTDDGRYRLFDTVYPFVSDYGNFMQLESLLTGQYYINRFRAMLKQ